MEYTVLKEHNREELIRKGAVRQWGGLPDRETLQALQGYPLLRTDLNGWGEISTDGEQIWMEVEKK